MTDTGAAHPGTTDAGAASYAGTASPGTSDAGAASYAEGTGVGTTAYADGTGGGTAAYAGTASPSHPGTTDAGTPAYAGPVNPAAEVLPDVPPGLRAPRNQVSRRALWYWTTTAMLEAVALVGALTGIAELCGLDSAWWTAIGSVGGLLLVRAAVMPRWRYRVHRWEVTGDALYTRTGWFSVRWGIAPISRIQTIDSERRLPERIFGLANVTATTASAAGHIKIRGLDLATADRLLSDLSLATASIPGDAT